jgi:hypothetical protein
MLASESPNLREGNIDRFNRIKGSLYLGSTRKRLSSGVFASAKVLPLLDLELTGDNERTEAVDNEATRYSESVTPPQ